MALQDNSIAGFSFIALKGETVPPSYQVVTEDRPGVDGTEFILVGNKGRVFSLVSQVDCASYADGKIQLAAYLALKALAAVPMVQGGVPSIGDGFMVKVMDVMLLRLLTIRGAVGNLKGTAPNQGFVECRWDLVAIPN